MKFIIEFDNPPLKIPLVISDLLDNAFEFVYFIFPVLLGLATVIVNISLISGGIMYLLDHEGDNGKMMILRSVIILMLIICIFNLQF